MAKQLLLLLAFALPFAGIAQAQTGTVSGTINDETGAGLPGATVQVEGTQLGASADNSGSFTVSGVPTGSQTLVFRFVGYAQLERNVVVNSGETTIVSVSLAAENRELAGLEVLADRAIDRKTPSTYTNISKDQITQQLGSRDVPLVLNTAPSVYATEQGGGAGDARINVRGFDQRNTAVMINGVPVNDMENGWVYWSNWDGLGDAATSVQLQRGMSAVNLAVPSVGGTLNILTDPTQQRTGVALKQEIGSFGFLKTTLQASTGLIDDRFALTVNGVRKTGDGFYQGTWTDAWAYYLASSYRINDTNTLALYAVGAPQEHGQNLYKMNVAAYDMEFALDLDDYDPNALQDNGGLYNEAGRDFSQNFAPVDPSYTGDQAYGSRTFSRFDPNFLNERENFFHKPQVNLNWYSQLNSDLLWSTTAYYSGGAGGGTGFVGPSSQVRTPHDGGDGSPFASLPFTIDWDATIQRNIDNGGESVTILRNSRNNQWTLGAVSKLTANLNDNVTGEIGIDARTASIDHYREVHDLLGGDYYVDNRDDFNPNRQVGFGEKIDYNDNNTVRWLGGYAQAEVEKGPFTAFGMAGVNTVSYTFEDFFTEDPDNAGETLKLESGALTGYQFKAGGLYNVNNEVGVYINGGYIAKTPIFDGAIDDVNGVVNPDIGNEDIFTFEGGVNWRSQLAAVKLAGYFTNWSNRTINLNVTQGGGSSTNDAVVFMRGVEQQHMGAELEAAVQPIPEVHIDAGISVGNWKYTSDVNADFAGVGETESIPILLPIEDLKVGDQPQTQFAYGLTVLPTDGLSVQFLGRTYANHSALFNPVGRALQEAPGGMCDDGDGNPVPSESGYCNLDGEVGEIDRTPSWKVPGYTVLDANARYQLPLQNMPVGVEIFGNVFNLLDTAFIMDAVDNSSFNAWDNDHDADDAEVFFGLPRRFNVGIRLTY